MITDEVEDAKKDAEGNTLIIIDEKKARSSCRMMNDVASDDEEDSVTLRRQRRGLFGFQVLSSKMMRESMITSMQDSGEGSLLPSCQGNRASFLPGLRKKKKNKMGTPCLGQDNELRYKEGINLISSGSDSDDESKTKNKKKKDNGESSDSDIEPEQYEITNADGSKTQMILTASGPIPLDFSNTKII